jgi:nitroreductase
MTTVAQRTNDLDQVIRLRRTTKPEKMNGNSIPDQTVRELLELADWAPTHAYTEPWYFVVYAGEAVRRFCKNHAEMYKQNTPEERFQAGTYEKLEHMGDKASHLIALCMKRGENPNIPALEEVVATSCAAQNLLLGAAARELAVYWGTGGQTLKPAMKEYLGLGEADQVLGLLYLGYADNVLAEGKRNKPLEQKIKWVD